MALPRLTDGRSHWRKPETSGLKVHFDVEQWVHGAWQHGVQSPSCECVSDARRIRVRYVSPAGQGPWLEVDLSGATPQPMFGAKKCIGDTTARPPQARDDQSGDGVFGSDDN